MDAGEVTSGDLFGTREHLKNNYLYRMLGAVWGIYGNPLNRYLLNSPMLPQFQRDADGGITFLIQPESLGADTQANWLPASKGPFFMAMRLYWPKAEALNGTWVAPPLQRTK